MEFLGIFEESEKTTGGERERMCEEKGKFLGETGRIEGDFE